jgi:hypothetical protein
MADLAEGFSPKQFQLAIAAEADGIGGGEATVGDYKFINIDSIEMPSLNPQQVLDVRHGVGRTLKKVDMFLTNKLTVKEISFSGIADATILPMLLANITNTNHATSFPIEFDYSGQDLSFGDSVSSANSSLTFAVLLVTPEAAQQQYFKGCVLTSLTISGNVGEETGRIKISGTFKSGSIPALNSTLTPTHNRASFNTNYFMTDYGDSGSTNAVTTIAGLSDPVLKSFSLTIENDAVFTGYDTSGNFQQIHRAIPEVAVTFDAVVKYDADTDNLIQTFAEQSTGTVVNTLTAADSVTRNIDISLPTCMLTEVGFSEEDAMFLSVSSKAVADTSGNILLITLQ